MNCAQIQADWLARGGTIEMPSRCDDCQREIAPCTHREDCDHTGRWEWYMVEDRVWAAAGMPIFGGRHSGDGHLCIACLERRLGRKLTPRDFTSAAINLPSRDDTPLLAARRRGR